MDSHNTGFEVQQIPLDLLTQDRFRADRFVATERTQPLLDGLLNHGLNLTPLIFIVGPEGSGKSHLAHIAATARNARLVASPSAFSETDFSTFDYVIDDAETFSQTLLFHLFNHVQKIDRTLVMTSKIHPLSWQYEIPDLASRLNSMRIMLLPEPDEPLKVEILKKLFLDRMISPSPDFLDYLIKRCDRSVESMRQLVTNIERFANGRPFNRALARDYLDQSESLPFEGFLDQG